jgi:hypothetical protein
LFEKPFSNFEISQVQWQGVVGFGDALAGGKINR